MSIYPAILKTKYLAAKALGMYKIDVYDEDINNYTEEFLKKYKGLLRKTEKAPDQDAPVVLFYSVLQLSYSMHIEAIVGRIFERLGFRVVILTSYYVKLLSDCIFRQIYGFCDILYIQDFLEYYPSKEAQEVITSLNKATCFDEIKHLRYRHTSVGLHALASFDGKLPTDGLQGCEEVMKKISDLLRQSCRYVDAMDKVLNLLKPVKVISVEKGDVTNCEIFYESIYRGIDYIQWCSCHESDAIIEKRYNTLNYRAHPFSISDETWAEVLKDNNEHSDIVLNSFKTGYLDGDWFRYKKLAVGKKAVDRDHLINRLGLNPNKKIAIIFSHILNDANFFYGDDLFVGGFSEWLVKTVQAASQNEEVNWLIKLHPANVYRRTYVNDTGEYGEIEAIKNTLGEVPSNIKIIPPDIDINPYSFFMITDYGITVRGTIGAELPCFGIPVLTAGTGRYSGKGFTIDSETAEEYLGKVANIHTIKPLSDAQRMLALKHAYLFFKERPAKYDTAMQDVYPYPQGHPLYRDIDIIDKDIFNNQQLVNIARFIAFSKDEDYLASRRY